MTYFRKQATRLSLSVILAVVTQSAFALNILLTNDDGWDSLGIQNMKTALQDAGHSVTLVGPLSQQSGKGGSLNTDNGASIAVTEPLGAGTAEWAVDSTPSDAVRAAFGGIVDKATIDLVVAGINAGQNLGITGTQASGTINAALTATHFGVPAIAISAERLLKSSEEDTDAAYPGIADFIVRLIERLDDTRTGGKLLPTGTMLNVNYPVFDIGSGLSPGRVSLVKLYKNSNVEFTFTGDPTTGSMTSGLDFGNYFAPAEPLYGDRAEFENDNVTVTLLDGNMSVRGESTYEYYLMGWRLFLLEP